MTVHFQDLMAATRACTASSLIGTQAHAKTPPAKRIFVKIAAYQAYSAVMSAEMDFTTILLRKSVSL